jgi:hypothetical protein
MVKDKIFVGELPANDFSSSNIEPKESKDAIQL